jgi:hypothetical protein
MDKSTRHLPARLAPLFHGVGAIIHETGVERAASTGYVASAAGPREGMKRSNSQTTFADDVRPPTPPSLEGHDFDRERLQATRDRTDAVWAACAAEAGSMWDDACIRARAALETERYRVDHHRGPRDTYGIIRSFSAVHDRLLSALAAASRRAFEELPKPVLFHLLFLKAKEAAMAQRAHGVGALVSQELVGEARGAMLAAGASFAAKAESCVLCAPRSVDADELARLLAPPKELEALQARLLLRATPTSHGGAAAGRRRAKRFMTLMTGWIDDLHALGLELETAVLAPCMEPPSKRSLLGFLRKNPPTENTRVVGRPKSAVERGNPALAVTGEKEFDAEEIKLREEIGQGRGGLVRRGVYRGRDVAVKLVFSEALASTRQRGPSELRTEFDREVAMLRRVSHINCVAFFGTFGDPKYGAHGLVMEFLRDGSLQQRLEAPHLPSVDDVALQLADGVAAGLAHLHGVGILHRDLKPANVLLDGDRAKLADFGYSSAVVGDGADQSVCGTPRWMAPEVVFGRPYSFGADVYSYALILWQLLAWDPKPYLEYGNDMKRFLKALDGGSRPDVEACRRRGAPEVLCAMLDKAWQKDAEKRPAMTAVLDAIDAGRKAVAASWSQV